MTSGNQVCQPAITAIERLVRKHYPAARGLILTGSAARGEAAVAVRPEGMFWLSDVDMLVVVGHDANMSREAQALNDVSRRVSRELAEGGTKVSVELKPAPLRYFRTVRPSLFAYELRTCGRQLFGDTDCLALIREFDWREIPKEDAWRLTSNRMVEWLGYLAHPAREPLPAQFHIVTKQYLDILTSLTVFSGHYAPRYAERVSALDGVIDWLRRVRTGTPADLLVQAVRMAWEFRRDPIRFEWLWDSCAPDLPSAMRRAGCSPMYDELAGLLPYIWRSESAWTCPGANGRDPAEVMARLGGFRGRARGWARLLLTGTARPRWRTARLLASGTPRTLLYACAARLLDTFETRDAEPMEWVLRHMPVAPVGGDADWAGLARQCVRTWDKVLRHASA